MEITKARMIQVGAICLCTGIIIGFYLRPPELRTHALPDPMPEPVPAPEVADDSE